MNNDMATVSCTDEVDDAEDRDRPVVLYDEQLSTKQAERIYNSLPPIDSELSALLHGDRKTQTLTITERQRIVDFAQAEALRLIAEGVVPNSRMFPVNVIAVANSLGVSVNSMRIRGMIPQDHPIAGRIIKKAGEQGGAIQVTEDGDARMRFTIAHELGHYITGRREIPPLNGPTSKATTSVAWKKATPIRSNSAPTRSRMSS